MSSTSLKRTQSSSSRERKQARRECVNCRERPYSESHGRAERLCVPCLQRLPRLDCTHCGIDFHRLDRMNRHADGLARCVQCTDLFERFGEPSVCKYCACKSAFRGAVCRLCASSEEKYGKPLPCEHCEKRCAFNRPAEARVKIGGKLLCFLCTREYKRKNKPSSSSSASASAPNGGAKPDSTAALLASIQSMHSTTSASGSAAAAAASAATSSSSAKAASKAPKVLTFNEFRRQMERMGNEIHDAQRLKETSVAEARVSLDERVHSARERVRVAREHYEALKERYDEAQKQVSGADEEVSALRERLRSERARRFEAQERLFTAQRINHELEQELNPPPKEVVNLYETVELPPDFDITQIAQIEKRMRDLSRSSVSRSMRRPSAIGVRLTRGARSAHAAAERARMRTQYALEQQELAAEELREQRELEEREETAACVAANVPRDELTALEQVLFADCKEGDAMHHFLLMRSHVLRLWHRDVGEYTGVEECSAEIDDRFVPLLRRVHAYLERYGFINVGQYRNAPPPPQRKQRVIVIGAGWAGVAAAHQLRSFGYEVVVLEARDRVGGRCHSDRSFATNGNAVDLGASIITGTEGNPIMQYVKQQRAETHNVLPDCPLWGEGGKLVDKEADDKMYDLWNKFMAAASELKNMENAEHKSLGGVIDRLVDQHGPPSSPLHERLLYWHRANLEYGTACDLAHLSLKYWDQDDQFSLEGDHALLPRGFSALIESLCTDIDVRLRHRVRRVEYSAKQTKVYVEALGDTDGDTDGDGDGGGNDTVTEHELIADAVLCTLPLGVLKRNAVQFEPPLPQRKRDAIEKLGFGLLNKVVLEFDRVFWDDALDYFGNALNSKERRGEFYIFWNLHRCMNEPVLVALSAGPSAHTHEERSDDELVAQMVDVLRTMHQLDEAPTVVRSAVTRWKRDPYACGSYSYIAVGALPEHIDALGEPVGRRLHFAGEATSRRYPATTTGAVFTGLRTAGHIDRALADLRGDEI